MQVVTVGDHDDEGGVTCLAYQLTGAMTVGNSVGN